MIIHLVIVAIKQRSFRQKRGSFVSLAGQNIFFRATLLKRENSSCTKILIKSTDFDVNIFLLWHLEVDRYIYYRQLRGKRRYSKGTSCNSYFGLFFMIIYFYFFQMFFFFFVFSGTSFVYTKKENIFFQSYTTNKGKYSRTEKGTSFAVFRCNHKLLQTWCWISNSI